MWMILKKSMKNEIIIDSGALLEFFKLLIDSLHIRMNKAKNDQLIRFLELFRGRSLYLIPQVLAELYSLLKRDAKPSKSRLRHWLDLLESNLKHIMEKYVPKDNIMEEKKYLDFGFTDIALMKVLNKNNFLLSTDRPLIEFCRNRGLEAFHIEEIFYI